MHQPVINWEGGDGRRRVQRLAPLKHRRRGIGADGAEAEGRESAEGQIDEEEEGRKQGQQREEWHEGDVGGGEERRFTPRLARWSG